MAIKQGSSVKNMHVVRTGLDENIKSSLLLVKLIQTVYVQLYHVVSTKQTILSQKTKKQKNPTSNPIIFLSDDKNFICQWNIN